MALSLPQALLNSLENTAGFERAAFLEVHQRAEALTSIRYNPARLASYKGVLHGNKIPWNPYGYYLPGRPAFTQDPLFHGGLYYVQEPGSQFLWEVLSQATDNTAAVKVLDLCAAPGGKSTLLSAYFENGLIVANEVIKSRAAVLTENVTKWGTGNVVVTNNDPRHFSRLEGFFDIMLIDAPCSGSGLFRKDNNAIAEWSEESVWRCSRRQQRILADAYPALKEGGLLIYATCSYSPQEDEEMLDWLMESFSLENIPLTIPGDWGITTVTSARQKAEGYKFYPYKVQSEGFFVAAFYKKAPAGTVYDAGNLQLAGRQEIAEVLNWISPKVDPAFIKQHNSIISVSKNWLEDINILQKNLYLKKAGIEIGEIKNKGLVPAHDLAISTILKENVQKIDLDKAQSLQYLKRKEIEVTNNMKGWAVAVYEGLSLGWMKMLPDRINNYYPPQWRILKD